MKKNSCSTKSADASCSTKMDCGGESKCCFATILKGALLGGLVMFLYFSASWMLLPLHKTSFMSFKNEKAVVSALTTNVEKSGVYMLPQKPFAFVSVSLKGIDEKAMNCSLFKQGLLCLLGAALLTMLLKKTPQGCCPIAGSMIVGVLVGTFAFLPNFIWYHFPLNITLLGIMDNFLAITLAGVAISKVALKSGSMGDCGDKKSGCH